MEQEERFFACPYCGESISMLLDLSIDEQDFVEDCEVCCRPIQIRYRVLDGEVSEFDLVKIQ